MEIGAKCSAVIAALGLALQTRGRSVGGLSRVGLKPRPTAIRDHPRLAGEACAGRDDFVATRMAWLTLIGRGQKGQLAEKRLARRGEKLLLTAEIELVTDDEAPGLSMGMAVGSFKTHLQRIDTQRRIRWQSKK